MSSKSKPKPNITEQVLVFLTKQLAIKMSRKEVEQKRKEEKAKNN